MEKLFEKLYRFGGAIVRDCDVSPAEKTRAIEDGSVFVDAEGLVFVWVRKPQPRKSEIGWGA